MNEYLTKRKHIWLLNLWRDSEDYEWSVKCKSEEKWGTIFINLIDKQLVGISNGGITFRPLVSLSMEALSETTLEITFFFLKIWIFR